MASKSIRRATVAAVLCAAATLAGSGTAFAGEITGNDKSLKQEDGTLHGRSECAFSGQNDTPGEDGFGRTQSWGQLDKDTRAFLTSIDVDPGHACNPTRAGAHP